MTAAGFSCAATDVYDDATAHAVSSFQSSRGLPPDGVCDLDTWSALVEAGFGLGDRLLYLTSPMQRGDDVADLQLRLGVLGFDAGRVDGIFGPLTEMAVGEFQQQMGLVTDRVCGPDTVTALRRLQPRGGNSSVAGVRDRVQLLARDPQTTTLRVALVHQGDADTVVAPLAADLTRGGAGVTVVIDSDWSRAAAAVNQFDAEVCVAISLRAQAVCDVRYFETTGFHSRGGRRLAETLVEELPSIPGGWTAAQIQGMRLSILRETRPPTIHLELGPTDIVDHHHSLVVAAIHRALRRWRLDPA